MANEIRNILVPIDFTKENSNFLNVAAAIAKRHSAKVHFLNVVKSGLMGTGSAFSGKFYYHGNSLLADSENKLDEQKEKFCKIYRGEVFTKCSVGSVAERIMDYAQNNWIDLIVLGVDYPKKRPGFISSNTYEVISNSEVPVITVPFSCRNSDFSELIYPVRDTEDAVSKLTPVLPIAKRNGSKIKLVGLASEKGANSVNMVSNSVKFLRVKLAKQKLDCTVEEVLVTAKPAEEILEACEKSDADLVAVNVTTEKPITKIFSNNFTENIIYKSKIPVLFFRKDKEQTPLEQYVKMPYPMIPV